MAVPVHRQAWLSSIHFVTIHSFAAKIIATKSLKINILEFKVIQGHRCRHSQKARR